MLNGASHSSSRYPPSSSIESSPIRHSEYTSQRTFHESFSKRTRSVCYQLFDFTPTPVIVRRPIDPTNFTISRIPVPDPVVEQTIANLKACVRYRELVEAARDIAAYINIQPPRTPLPDSTLLVDLLNSQIGTTSQSCIAIVLGNPPPPSTPVIAAGPPPNVALNLSPMLLPSPFLSGVPNSPIEALPSASLEGPPNSFMIQLSQVVSHSNTSHSRSM